MSGVHLHLLINHAPILGSIFAAALLAGSFLWAPDVLRRAAMVTLLVVAVTGLIADQTGIPAEQAAKGLPGVLRRVIHEHEEMGEKAFLFAGILGLVAAAALFRWRRSPFPRGAAVVLFGATLFVSGAMAYTGLLGGRIRHTELREGATRADAVLIEPPRAPREGAPPP
jgi:hypothetical protein